MLAIILLVIGTAAFYTARERHLEKEAKQRIVHALRNQRLAKEEKARMQKQAALYTLSNMRETFNLVPTRYELVKY